MGLLNSILKMINPNEGEIGSFSSSDVAVPAEFSGFPIYQGKQNGKIEESMGKRTPYKRITMHYAKDNDKIKEYEQSLISEGFIKKSDIRYDKEINGQFCYIIIEKEGWTYKIAFHIKTAG